MTPKQEKALRYLAKKCEGFGESCIRAKDVAERLFQILDDGDDGGEPFFPEGPSTVCDACGTFKSGNIVCDRCLAKIKETE